MVKTYSAAANPQVRIVKYVGDMYVLHRRREPPTLFAPPYMHLDFETHFFDMDICATLADETDYLGLYGSSHTVYDIVAHEISAAACGKANVDHLSSFEADGVAHNLRVGHQELASCRPYHWKDFSLKMTSDIYGKNLIFEVLSEDAEVNPEALAVSLFEGAIPDDREHVPASEF